MWVELQNSGEGDLKRIVEVDECLHVSSMTVLKRRDKVVDVIADREGLVYEALANKVIGGKTYLSVSAALAGVNK